MLSYFDTEEQTPDQVMNYFFFYFISRFVEERYVTESYSFTFLL